MTKWKAELLVKMRRNGIKQKELAKEAGYTEQYVSMIFNGAKNPKCGKTNLTAAINRLIEKKKAEKKAAKAS